MDNNDNNKKTKEELKAEKKKLKEAKKLEKKAKKAQDNRTILDKADDALEKAEDTLDNVLGGFQDIFYGDNFTEDIPATMETPQGIKKINKVQTRRNIHKRLLGPNWRKKTLIIFLVIIGIGLIALFFEFVINKLLLS